MNCNIRPTKLLH